jgi:hypothetical protein
MYRALVLRSQASVVILQAGIRNISLHGVRQVGVRTRTDVFLAGFCGLAKRGARFSGHRCTMYLRFTFTVKKFKGMIVSKITTQIEGHLLPTKIYHLTDSVKSFIPLKNPENKHHKMDNQIAENHTFLRILRNNILILEILRNKRSFVLQ